MFDASKLKIYVENWVTLKAVRMFSNNKTHFLNLIENHAIKIDPYFTLKRKEASSVS
jgi:hypothetical protein